MKNAKDDKKVRLQKKQKQKKGHSEPEKWIKNIMSLALRGGGGGVDIAAFVRSYTGYLAEVHARVESPNPADSVRKI